MAVAFLSGELLQGQIGVGYAAVGEMLRAAGAARAGHDAVGAAAMPGDAGPPPAPSAAPSP